MKKCAFVYNPESGKTNSKKDIDKIIELLEINGYETLLCPTKYKGHAVKIVEELNDIDLLISCGGDGTLNEVVTGNLHRNNKLTLGHLPTGTTNDVGAMYGYTKNLITNLQLLLEGSIKNIDVCLVNGQPFVYVACIGNYVDIAYNTPRDLKKKFGRMGYIINAINELKRDIKKYKLTYEVDGKSYSGEYSFIFISNTSRIGGFNNIYDDVKLDDSMFEVVFIDVFNKAQLAVTMTSVLTSDINKVKGVTYFKTNNLSITFDEMPIESWCIDGEEMKHDNKTFEFNISKDINMMVPKKNIVKLFKNIEEVDQLK